MEHEKVGLVGVGEVVVVGPDEELESIGRGFDEAESVEDCGVGERERGERGLQGFGPGGGFVGVDELGHGSRCFCFC